MGGGGVGRWQECGQLTECGPLTSQNVWHEGGELILETIIGWCPMWIILYLKMQSCGLSSVNWI